MSKAYFELDLPLAPAVMVGDEIIVEGSDVEKVNFKQPSVGIWGSRNR